MLDSTLKMAARFLLTKNVPHEVDEQLYRVTAQIRISDPEELRDLVFWKRIAGKELCYLRNGSDKALL